MCRIVERNRRRRFALCLSGGGYRAALFHLGALRRLNELGLVGEITTIASVSGGSIVAGHLAHALDWPMVGSLPNDEWYLRVTAPIRRLTTVDVRTASVLLRANIATSVFHIGALVVLPWYWLYRKVGERTAPFIKGSTGEIEDVARVLDVLYGVRRLTDLPEHPQFRLCATNHSSCAYWVFSRDSMGDVGGTRYVPPKEFTVGLAAAISACFPPLFDPVTLRLANLDRCLSDADATPPGSQSTPEPTTVELNDGGNFDNTGLEAVWNDHDVVFVSDGGASIGHVPSTGVFNMVARLSRYAAISDHAGRALRIRHFRHLCNMNNLQGVYWGIGGDSSVSSGYSQQFAAEWLATIRTDLDAFTEEEAGALENHGYFCCDSAVWHSEAWGGHLGEMAARADAPYPHLMDEEFLKKKLARSRQVRLLGRGWLKRVWESKRRLARKLRVDLSVQNHLRN